MHYPPGRWVYLKFKKKIYKFPFWFQSCYNQNSQDVERLIKLLPNVKHNRVIPNYNHVDFNYGKRSRKLIYNDIVKFFLSEEASKV